MNHNPVPSQQAPQDSSSYALHSRVILSGLQKAPHLNGKHGRIASPFDHETKRYAVDLDISTHQGRVNVKPSNLLPEPILAPSKKSAHDTPSHDSMRIAGTSNGSLEETHGRAINYILDAAKFIVGMYVKKHPLIESIDSIADLRESGNNYHGEVLRKLNNIVWDHWTENGSLEDDMPRRNESISTQGIYGLLLDFVSFHVPSIMANMTPESPNLEFFKIIPHAVESKQAMAAWGKPTRLEGDFWVVGCDTRPNSGGGTYLIPDANHNVVYKVVGIRENLFPLLQKRCPNTIMKVPVRLLPWFGRLVYDGQIAIAGYARNAEEVFATQLKDRVREAERDGVVIESLKELEFV